MLLLRLSHHFYFLSWGFYFSLVRKKVFSQILKISLHSSQARHISLINNRLLAWRGKLPLHIPSRLITPLPFSDFKLTKPKIVCFVVKTCEDLWRPEIGLHADKPLYNNALSCLCEEWRLFCNFLFFMSLQTYFLHPASLWFSARNPMLCALHSYSFQPANTLLISCLAH